MCNGDTDIYLEILQIQAALVCLKANSGMATKPSEQYKIFCKVKAGCCIHRRDGYFLHITENPFDSLRASAVNQTEIVSISDVYIATRAERSNFWRLRRSRGRLLLDRFQSKSAIATALPNRPASGCGDAANPGSPYIQVPLLATL